MDLWSLAGSNLYGLAQNSYITDSILNSYSGLYPGQELVSGNNTFAKQLSQYSKYFSSGSMKSVLQVIEDNPELKEKVKDTLGEIYQEMVEMSRNKASAAETSACDKDNTPASSAQVSASYRYQMSNGRRTPTMHASAMHTPTNFSV